MEYLSNGIKEKRDGVLGIFAQTKRTVNNVRVVLEIHDQQLFRNFVILWKNKTLGSASSLRFQANKVGNSQKFRPGGKDIEQEKRKKLHTQP